MDGFPINLKMLNSLQSNELPFAHRNLDVRINSEYNNIILNSILSKLSKHLSTTHALTCLSFDAQGIETIFPDLCPVMKLSKKIVINNLIYIINYDFDPQHQSFIQSLSIDTVFLKKLHLQWVFVHTFYALL